MSNIVLETRNLCRDFKGFSAVKDVNLRIQEGHIHALIGPNGAGKTTCFNLLTKFLKPSSGKIFLRGQDITGLTPPQVARAGVGRSFQISSLFGQFTCLDNVRLALQRHRGHSMDFWRSRRALDDLKQAARELLNDVGLAGYEDTLAEELPYGRKRALEIATTLALKPSVLLLDEPTAGMTHEDVDRVVDLIRRVRAGRTVLIVEHNLSVVKGLCDRVTVLARGSVLAEGDYQSVAADPNVVAAYLGTPHA